VRRENPLFYRRLQDRGEKLYFYRGEETKPYFYRKYENKPKPLQGLAD